MLVANVECGSGKSICTKVNTVPVERLIKIGKLHRARLKASKNTKTVMAKFLRGCGIGCLKVRKLFAKLYFMQLGMAIKWVYINYSF